MYNFSLKVTVQMKTEGRQNWARIFKLLRSPRIDPKKPISPGCVAWQAGTITLPPRFLAPIDCLKITALVPIDPSHKTVSSEKNFDNLKGHNRLHNIKFRKYFHRGDKDDL